MGPNSARHSGDSLPGSDLVRCGGGGNVAMALDVTEDAAVAAAAIGRTLGCTRACAAGSGTDRGARWRVACGAVSRAAGGLAAEPGCGAISNGRGAISATGCGTVAKPACGAVCGVGSGADSGVASVPRAASHAAAQRRC